MMLFGWTVDQFAKAKDYHLQTAKIEASRDRRGLVTVRRWWLSRRQDQPGGVEIIGSAPTSDDAMSWACDAFCSPDK